MNIFTLAEILALDNRIDDNRIRVHRNRAAFINEARKRGRKIPQDLKIVGYDGTETIRNILPDLTTIKQPIKLIAKTSIDLLIKKIEGDFSNIESKIALPVSLIEGRTT